MIGTLVTLKWDVPLFSQPGNRIGTTLHVVNHELVVVLDVWKNPKKLNEPKGFCGMLFVLSSYGLGWVNDYEVIG